MKGVFALNRFVLGLFDGPSGGAALLEEGRLVALAEEDRITRQHGARGLPRASVQAVLRDGEAASGEIAAVFVATNTATYWEGAGAGSRAPLLYRVGTARPAPRRLAHRIRESFADARRRFIDEALRSEFGVSTRIEFLDHHLAHSIGAAYTTGRPNCLTVTIDGGADGAWAAVTSFRDGVPERVAQLSGEGSALAFLQHVCHELGIPDGLDRHRRLEDLASRGDPDQAPQLAPLFRSAPGSFEFTRPPSRGVSGMLSSRAGREDLAACAIRIVSDLVCDFIEFYFSRSGHDRLVLGGDLFEISPIVQAVLDADDRHTTMVCPAPGDVGLPVGAASAGCLAGYLEEPIPFPQRPLPSPFLGRTYHDTAIEPVLRRHRMLYEPRPQIERDIARFLVEGRAVARFEGRAEIGNRGLGNRSLMRSPLGRLRRGRTSFVLVPGFFHALVREDAFHELFDEPALAPEDLRSFPRAVRPHPEFALRCHDLVGPDNLVRVQTCSHDSNPKLCRILREFQSWSGMPCLAIAPFRLPDEPLVASPVDAIRTFRPLGADVLVLGSYLVQDPRQPESSDTPLLENPIGS